MADPIEVDIELEDNKTDFVKLSSGVFHDINIKVGLILFLIGIFIFSDLFIDGILSKVSDATHGECTTTKGTFIQLFIYFISYLLVDYLAQKKIL
jgi:hypothetical protein